MKTRIEQDHEQHPDFALILPRGAAYAPLPQAPEAGANKVRLTLPASCAKPASGHTAAAPPSSVMNSRRLMSLPYLGSLLSNCCATGMMSSLR